LSYFALRLVFVVVAAAVMVVVMSSSYHLSDCISEETVSPFSVVLNSIDYGFGVFLCDFG
jgi:hypothetical protein